MTRRRIGMTVTIAAVIGFLGSSAAWAVLPTPTPIQVPNTKTLMAVSYSTWMTQAYDACDPAVTAVGGIAACPSVSNSTHTFRLAMLSISRSGKVALVGTGFWPNKTAPYKVQIRLVVRTSTRVAPLTTWVDSTLDCPVATCTASGACIQRTDLSACAGALLSDVAKPNRNIEIISAELLEGPGSTSPGAVIARPGVLRP